MEQVPHMTQVADVSIRFDVEIQMADDTVLRADVYLPKSLATPVLISRTPYLKGTIPGIAAAVNPVSAVRKGFAVIMQDVRGRSASDGDFVPFVNEASDGAETARWAARQDWCDGVRRLHPGELANDGWTKVVVELGATSQAFLKGHCLAVQISSSNFPRFDVASNTANPVRLARKRVAATQQVACGGVHASRLILPVVPAAPTHS